MDQHASSDWNAADGAIARRLARGMALLTLLGVSWVAFQEARTSHVDALLPVSVAWFAAAVWMIAAQSRGRTLGIDRPIIVAAVLLTAVLAIWWTTADSDAMAALDRATKAIDAGLPLASSEQLIYAAGAAKRITGRLEAATFAAPLIAFAVAKGVAWSRVSRSAVGP